MEKFFKKKVFVPFHMADPAGILFFGNAFTLAHEVYEHFILDYLQVPWKDWFHHPDRFVPLKHVQAHYYAPIAAGDWIDVEVKVTKCSTNSFALAFHFSRDGRELCLVETVHVFCSKATQQKMAIPPPIAEKLLS